MNYNKNPFFLGLILLSFSLFCSSCRKGQEEVHAFISKNNIKRDTLRAATLSGSMSYFMYKGEEMGYEYELLKNFSDSAKLPLKLLVAESENRLFELLDNKEVDLIAYTVPITLEGKEKYLYCGREVINEQVLVQPKGEKKGDLLNNVLDLVGKDVWVIEDSKYHKRLLNLNEEIGGGIQIHLTNKDTITTEDLIEMVSNGEIPYTVSDEDLARLNKTYYPKIDIRLKISHPQRSSWAVRKNSNLLGEKINSWTEENFNTPTYQARIKRYFEMSKLPGDSPAPIIGEGQISPYDYLFQEYASMINWDWRLLASIAYQESKFHLDKESWAGAKGLMGIMPKTAKAFGVSPEDMDKPESSIKAAVGLIQRLNKAFSNIKDENERIKFILASYNAGSGHIYDAQALAEKYDQNPHRWDDVKEFLKLKHLPEYYQDPVVKNGFYRSGKHTSHYVQAVMERWQYYQKF